jgi:hypothetical protein
VSSTDSVLPLRLLLVVHPVPADFVVAAEASQADLGEREVGRSVGDVGIPDGAADTDAGTVYRSRRFRVL